VWNAWQVLSIAPPSTQQLVAPVQPELDVHVFAHARLPVASATQTALLSQQLPPQVGRPSEQAVEQAHAPQKAPLGSQVSKPVAPSGQVQMSRVPGAHVPGPQLQAPKPEPSAAQVRCPSLPPSHRHEPTSPGLQTEPVLPLPEEQPPFATATKPTTTSSNASIFLLIANSIARRTSAWFPKHPTLR